MAAGDHGNNFIHALVIFTASLMIQIMIAVAGSKVARFFSNPSTLMYFNLASSMGIMAIGISKLL